MHSSRLMFRMQNSKGAAYSMPNIRKRSNEPIGIANHSEIAVAAGVSIGSIYQYFPSREALVAAVSERHSHEVLSIRLRAI